CALPIGIALVAPCTNSDRGPPHHVAVDWQTAGLKRPTWARTEDVRSISERRLLRRDPLGSLTDPDPAAVRRLILLMTSEWPPDPVAPPTGPSPLPPAPQPLP